MKSNYDLTEMRKLEQYLEEHGYNTEYTESYDGMMERHQLTVYRLTKGMARVPVWDVVCQDGSYGSEKGLLELYGKLVNKKEHGDEVIGWLTADDVIAMLEK